MGSRYCKHDDDPDTCPPCNAGKYEPVASNIGPVFAARFQGMCPDCLDDINPNDECCMVESRAWHRACAEMVR